MKEKRFLVPNFFVEEALPRLKDPHFKLLASHFLMVDTHSEQTHRQWRPHIAKTESTAKAHRYDEMHYVACEFLKTVNVEGSFCEFGCYTGISSAKLSIVASLASKKLHIFDSFQGLPDVEEYGSLEQKKIYKKYQYTAGLKTVRDNIFLYGIPENTTLVPGWYSETLQNYSSCEKIACAFIDVDLCKSLEEVLDFVLPRLQKNGVIISHEAQDPDYLPIFEKYGLLDDDKYIQEGVGTGIFLEEHTNLCSFTKIGE